jgi:serine/threonine protein kinase/Tol biopolymer transport system component
MKCPKCQSDNPDTQSFCGDCGTKLGVDKEAPAITKTLETPFPQLTKGTTLTDRYEILGALGTGGMGEVYLAEDTNLKRQVAIKVLPQQFALDKERLARFEREARLLASLNHPNIATIYGLEKSDGQQFLVMELVEGETLRELISKGPLPLDEALETCKQIAEGLESAHEKGIIHRDLKPSNVKVTPDGKVKILDFGVAKAFREQPDDSDTSKSQAATDEMTQPGMILGTAAYMSPEQARGKAVDKRTDIWAFGCILYECLTGKRPFQGESTSEIIASILKSEPDWHELSSVSQSSIRNLIRRCLRKDKNRRQHDISDARIEIEDALNWPGEADEVGAVNTGQRGWPYVFPWILATVVVTASVTFFLTIGQRSPSNASVVRAEIGIEPANRLGGSTATEQRTGYWRPSRTSIAMSPDGNTIIFEGVDEKGTRLYRRRLDEGKAVPIPDTEGGRDPFFSPDGNHIGFWAKGRLMKISPSGGMASSICEIGRPWGASWGPDDIIIYSSGTRLRRVPAKGGDPEIITQANQENGEIAHIQPSVLPSGDGVLFSIRTYDNPWYDAKVALLSLKTMEWLDLINEGSDAQYSPTGHLVFARHGELWAVSFSIDRLKVTGEAKPVMPDIMHAINGRNRNLYTHAAQYSFSENGNLAYISGGIYPDREEYIVYVSKSGKINPMVKTASSDSFPIMSPDYKRIAYRRYGENREIWTYDIVTNFAQPVVSSVNRGSITALVWTPPLGKRVTYWLSGIRPSGIYWKNADGTGEQELLVENGTPSSWSPDGKFLAFIRSEPRRGNDIWIFSIEDRHSFPFLNSQYDERYPEFSPDGNFLAYCSNRTGQAEVYVTPFPGTPVEIPVSNGGGKAPVWSQDMSEIYYLEIMQAPRAKMMVADISTSPSFRTDNRKVLFDYWGLGMSGDPSRGYDILPDGQGFICLGLYYGVNAVNYSEIPQDILDGLSTQDKKALAWFERWLKEDKNRVLSPELERMLQGLAVTKINIVQNWFEELKRLVPTKE